MPTANNEDPTALIIGMPARKMRIAISERLATRSLRTLRIVVVSDLKKRPGECHCEYLEKLGKKSYRSSR